MLGPLVLLLLTPISTQSIATPNFRNFNNGSVCNEIIQRYTQRERFGKPTTPSRRPTSKTSNRILLARGDLPDPKKHTDSRKRLSAQLEIESGSALMNAGFDTVHLPEEKNGNGYGTRLREDGVRERNLSNPDLLVEGRAFDVYAPEADGTLNMGQMSSKVRHQAQRIVINISRSNGLQVSEVIKKVKSSSWRPRGSLSGLEELFVIKDGKIVGHLTRSPNGYMMVPYTKTANNY